MQWRFTGCNGAGMIEGISQTSEVQLFSSEVEEKKTKEVSKNVTSEETIYRWSWGGNKNILFVYMSRLENYIWDIWKKVYLYLDYGHGQHMCNQRYKEKCGRDHIPS